VVRHPDCGDDDCLNGGCYELNSIAVDCDRPTQR
jgi:hypothetical protein